MKDISIVIVNYKMKDVLVACLRSLYRDITNSPLDVSVVVVDNNSEDGLREVLLREFPTALCVELGNNPGFGAAQNCGMAATEATYYFALNPDTDFSSDTNIVDRLYAFMEEHPKIGMIGPKIQYPDGTLQYSCWRFPTFFQPLFSRTSLGKKGRGQRHAARYFMKEFDHGSTIPVDAVMGSALFVRGTAVKEVGNFDDRFFMYFEDIDWCRRFWEANWPVYYVHDIVLTHIHGRGSAKVPGLFTAVIKNKLARDHIRSWLLYMWKWRSNKKFYEAVS
ncbi:MAG: glycosyltransferase family 2 protein [Candidatus Magasanikbacteria bacterium]|nr:glycosyltransferase family 2 protein [Candidatus Magasanikbacteria bacterium]